MFAMLLCLMNFYAAINLAELSFVLFYYNNQPE